MIKDKKTKNSEKQKQWPRRLNTSQMSNSALNPAGPFKGSKDVKTKSDLKLGSVYTFKITAIGANKIGIDEFSYGYSVLIPNAQLGEVVKAKIVKIQFKKYKYAVAEVIQKVQSSTIKKSELNGGFEEQKAVDQIPNLGETLEVTITKSGPKSTGIVELGTPYPHNYLLIVPNTTPGQKVTVQITRMKSKFAFGRILNTFKGNRGAASPSAGDASTSVMQSLKSFPKRPSENQNPILKEGSKINVLLPSKIGTPSGGYLSSLGLVLKLNGISKDSWGITAPPFLPSSKEEGQGGGKQGDAFTFPFGSENEPASISRLPKGSLPAHAARFPSFSEGQAADGKAASLPKSSKIVLFIRDSAKQPVSAKPGDRVKIQVVKVLRFAPSKAGDVRSALSPKAFGDTLVFGKIVEINPISSTKKTALIRGNIRQMLKNEMHFGEKVVKVHARMKKYIWLRKKGQNKNKPFVQNGRNIINLLKTRRCLNKALIQLSKYAVKGRTFLFLGTKKPAAELIKKVSLFTKNSFFVNTRWIGGMLTNWKSIKKSIQKISPILKEKQTIINAILEKRQNIRNRLLKKGLVLRKKSKLLIKKARALLLTFADAAAENPSGKDSGASQISPKGSSLTESPIQKTKKWVTSLNIKRDHHLEKSLNLIEKYNKLLDKKSQLTENSVILKQKASFVKNKYRTILSQLSQSQTKLKEFTTLFVLGRQIGKIQQLAKEQNIRLGSSASLPKGSSSFGASTVVSEPASLTESPMSSGTEEQPSGVIQATRLTNPPQEIFNKISLILAEASPLFSGGNELKNSSESSDTKSPNQEKVLILNKLLTQFSSFIPFIRLSIGIQQTTIKNLEEKLLFLKNTLQQIQIKIQSYISLNKKLKIELNKLKLSFAIERKIIRRLRTKIKQISAQKRLLQYLPKLRYLPTPQIKITETVQYLMKNIVDPKLKYPIELIYDQRVKNQSKKVGAARKKKWQRLEKYFGGISKMTKMKKNQISKIVAIIIGQQEQINAVRECKKLGIKMFNVVDTNCNPNLADHFIPANDDSRNSIKYILTAFLTRIKLAEKIRLRFKKMGTGFSLKMGSK